MVLEPLQTLSEFGGSASVRDGCARIAAQCSEDWLNSLPVIPQHGDLFYSNLLSHHGKWTVLDWESFGAIDLPYYDVLTLLLSLLRAGSEKTPDQWEPSLVEQVPALMESYAAALGLNTDVSLLLPLTLVNWFHLQWCDGRKEFTEQMYKAICHYFDHPGAWDRAFVAAASSAPRR